MNEVISSVQTDRAPAAIGPYSQAVRAGQFLFISGQIPLDPASGSIVPGDFVAQAKRVLANVDAVLSAAGLGRERVVKVTVFLADLAQFGVLNELYAEFFGAHRPARAVVEVSALPKAAMLELEAVALL